MRHEVRKRVYMEIDGNESKRKKETERKEKDSRA